MINNSTLVKLMRCKLIIEEVDKGTFPTSIDLLSKISKWLESIQVIYDDIKTEISERTLKRDRTDIKHIFNIDIAYCNTRKGYFIRECSNQSDQILNTLDAMHIFFIQKNIPNANKFIRFAPRQASGSEQFFTILKAIKDKKKVQFSYSQYEKKEKSNRKVSPLGLKEFKGFWYLISSDDVGIKTFGLDRIADLGISLENSSKLKDFDLDEYYKHCFGIVRLPHDKPQEIIIKTTPIKACYYKANPLHHSQKVIEETQDYTIFSLFMFFTYDLQQELRSHGTDYLEVLEPKDALISEKYS